MPFYWFILVGSGILIIIFPDLISYLIGGLLIFIGINILIVRSMFLSSKKQDKEYVSFGKYKIYKD